MINVFGDRKMEPYFWFFGFVFFFGVESSMRLDLGAALRTSFLLRAMMNLTH